MKKNDELEMQVDIISTCNKKAINNHYSHLRKWQIKISNKEAFNFGVMELMVLLIIVLSLLILKNTQHITLMAGSLFGIYSYILKFAAALDTIPYTIERISSLTDIAQRMEFADDHITAQNPGTQALILPHRAIHPTKEDLKISA